MNRSDQHRFSSHPSRSRELPSAPLVQPPKRSVPPTNELIKVEETLEYVVSTWRFVMFLAWRSQLSVAGIRSSRELMEPWASHWPRGVVLTVLTSSRPGIKPPSDEVRKEMILATRQAPAALKGIALISGKGGFVDSIIRSVISARQLLVRNAVPFQIFASPVEAAPWIGRAVGVTDVEKEFIAASEGARA